MEQFNVRQSRHFLLRYEDMVLDTRAQARRICEHADLRVSDGILDGFASAVHNTFSANAGHTTSATLADTIGRWKHELSPSLKSVCNEVFDGHLKFFGYAPA